MVVPGGLTQDQGPVVQTHRKESQLSIYYISIWSYGQQDGTNLSKFRTQLPALSQYSGCFSISCINVYHGLVQLGLFQLNFVCLENADLSNPELFMGLYQFQQTFCGENFWSAQPIITIIATGLGCRTHTSDVTYPASSPRSEYWLPWGRVIADIFLVEKFPNVLILSKCVMGKFLRSQHFGGQENHFLRGSIMDILCWISF